MFDSIPDNTQKIINVWETQVSLNETFFWWWWTAINRTESILNPTTSYYDKWQKFTDEEVHKIQLEEETLKKEMEKLTVANAMEEKTKRIQNEKKEMLRTSRILT